MLGLALKLLRGEEFKIILMKARPLASLCVFWVTQNMLNDSSMAGYTIWRASGGEGGQNYFL